MDPVYAAMLEKAARWQRFGDEHYLRNNLLAADFFWDRADELYQAADDYLLDCVPVLAEVAPDAVIQS